MKLIEIDAIKYIKPNTAIVSQRRSIWKLLCVPYVFHVY